MKCDFLVVGAGVSGICAAIQAGRLGLKTILIEKEMLLGGNNGPNLGVGATAAQNCNPYFNEMGIVEELEANINHAGARIYPTKFGYNIHPMWDDVASAMLEKENVTVLRRHIIIDCKTENNIIRSVTVLNIENMQRFDVFVDGCVIDCSGDAFLAHMAGADCVIGREGKAQTGESAAPDVPDKIISTASVTALVADTGEPCEFVPPPGTPKWNPQKPDNHFDPTKRIHFLWQVDEGGESEENHSLYTPQQLYKRLVSRIYSVWDYLKNTKFKEEAKNHQLIWISPILGRREGRRILGDYMLTQNDIAENREFEDAIAFGGSYLDEHLPSYDGGYEVRYYTRPLPYDIPYRCIYSRNIKNLFSGGRAIGVSHLAFTSTRLMRTCGALAQAAAVAAKLCDEYKCYPADIHKKHIKELRQRLLKEDAYIIGAADEDEENLAKKAKVSASSEAVLSRTPCNSEWKTVKKLETHLYCYNDKLDRFEVYIRNNGEEKTVSTYLAYGETDDIVLYDVPLFVYDNEKKRYIEVKRGEAKKNSYAGAISPTGTEGWGEYYSRDDNIKQKKLYCESTITVPKGFEGFIDLKLKNDIPFPQYTRKKFGQAVIVGIIGDIEVLTAPHPTGTLECKLDDEISTSAIPFFNIFPEVFAGAASNVTDGYNHRSGRANLHMWQADSCENEWICIKFDNAVSINEVRITFDITERFWNDSYIIKGEKAAGRLVKEFSVEIMESDVWHTVYYTNDNYTRLCKIQLEKSMLAQKIRLTAHNTWKKGEPARVCEIRVY